MSELLDQPPDTVDSVVDAWHARIDAALEAVRDAVDSDRDVVIAHDKLVGLLSRHLLGMEVAVCPEVAHRVADGPDRVRAHLRGARRMELTMRRIEQILWGDARAPRIPLDVLLDELVVQMSEHRAEESRMLAALDAQLGPDRAAAVAAHLRKATAHAPTRAHPLAPRRLHLTRAMYRPVGFLDHVRDTLSSRSIPSAEPPRRKQVGLWGAYALGRPLDRPDEESPR